MRVTNLIMHIVSLIMLIPDALFIGIAFLWGVQYLRGMEIIVVPLFVLTFFAGFVFTLVGGIILFHKNRKAPNKTYMKRELIVYGFTALSFGLMITYTLMIILNPAPKIPELSTDSSDTKVSVIDIAGFALALAGMIFTVVAGTIKNKKAKSTAGIQAVTQNIQSVPRPKFCTKCGTPTGVSGNFCRNCGSKLYDGGSVQ